MREAKQPWSPEEDATLLQLCSGGLTREAIGLLMGRSENGVKGRLKLLKMSKEERTKFYAMKRVSNAEEPAIGRPTVEMIRDRDARAMLPCRDLTAAFFGDPPLGLSALDGRR